MSFVPGSITQAIEEWKNRFTNANAKLLSLQQENIELNQKLLIALAEVERLKLDKMNSSKGEGSYKGEDQKKKKHEPGRTSPAATDNTLLSNE